MNKYKTKKSLPKWKAEYANDGGRHPSGGISIVIPVHNERENANALMREISQVFGSGFNRYCEVIWVDDGSTDGTTDWIREAIHGDLAVRILALPRNCGQSKAISVGIEAAAMPTIITLDGDGQDDPRDARRLLPRLDQSDLVIGCRTNRCDTVSKRVFSKAANLIRRMLTRSSIPDSGCSLRIFRKEAYNRCVVQFNGYHRFVPTMFESAGRRVEWVEVKHRPRKSGKSHYSNCQRMIFPLIDCLMLCWLRFRRLPNVRPRQIVQATEQNMDSEVNDKWLTDQPDISRESLVVS